MAPEGDVGFASLLENFCRSGNDPIEDIGDLG